MDHRLEVNGLPLPPLLGSLMAAGRWVHPGDAAIRELVPFLQGPVDFLGIESMGRAFCWSMADDPKYSAVFRVVRGSKSAKPVELPWLDADKAVFIAVNRIPGDDLGIALDYRTSAKDPRVVACEWLGGPAGCVWHQVSGTFTEFAQALGLGIDASQGAVPKS
jgi:hypothetical protein